MRRGCVVCVRICSCSLCRKIELLDFVLEPVRVLFHRCRPLPVVRSGRASTTHSSAHGTQVFQTLLRGFLGLNPDRTNACQPLFLSFRAPSVSFCANSASGVVAFALALPCIVANMAARLSLPSHPICSAAASRTARGGSSGRLPPRPSPQGESKWA